MKPILFTLPLGIRGWDLHTYGLAVAIGFAVGIVLAARQGRRVGMDPEALLDLSFWILVAGVLSSRLGFVLAHGGEFVRLCAGDGEPRNFGQTISDCAAPLKLWQGGLVFYGGAIGAAVVSWRFARRRGWSFGTLADLFAPSVALGHAFGRLGCFFAGCCFGKPTSSGIGVSFPPGSVAFEQLAHTGGLSTGATATPFLHPTQLYEAAGEIVIFLILVLSRSRQRFAGATALLYALLYGLLRLIVENFRGDPGRAAVGGASVAQIVSGAIVLAAAAAILVMRPRAP